MPRDPEANLLPAFPVSRPVAYVDVDYHTFTAVQGDLKIPKNQSNFSERDETSFHFIHLIILNFKYRMIISHFSLAKFPRLQFFLKFIIFSEDEFYNYGMAAFFTKKKQIPGHEALFPGHKEKFLT